MKETEIKSVANFTKWIHRILCPKKTNLFVISTLQNKRRDHKNDVHLSKHN